MGTKTKVILVSVAVATAFAFGRYSVPEKVKTVTVIKEVEKKTDDKKSDAEREKHKKTTIVDETLPDGTKRSTTTITEDTDTKKHSSDHSTDNTSKDTEVTKEVTRNQSPVTISALGGISPSFSSGLSLGPTVFGAHVSKRILGPISVGVWGLSSSVGGVSLGLSF